MIVGQGLALALAGLAIGAIAALALTRLMSGLLFQVGAADPVSFARQRAAVCGRSRRWPAICRRAAPRASIRLKRYDTSNDMFRAIKEQIDTIFREDPAAKSVIEIVLCYPGFHAILAHRLAHNCTARGFLCCRA